MIPRAQSLLTPPVLVCLLTLCGCVQTPIAPLPGPLPETLEWAAQEAPGAGAFFGLKTRENVGGSLEDLDLASGLRVTRVVEASPAAAAGLMTGDVLLTFGGHETNDNQTLEVLVAGSEPGSLAELEVRRGDTVFSLEVELRARTDRVESVVRREPQVLFRADPARSRAGWLTGHGGVVLVSSSSNGPFARAGIPVRSVVTAIDGAPVFSDRALLRLFQQQEPGARIDVEFTDPDGDARHAGVRLREQESRVTRFAVPVLFGYSADVSGEQTSFVLLDFWLISLFRYERQGPERHWRILRFFRFATGVGELSE